MSKTQVIQCIGTHEDETAQLRVLVRVLREDLKEEWIWGTEAKATLVIVDPIRLIGEAALRRANQRGVVCAQIINEEDPKPAEGLFLRRPVSREAMLELMNLVSDGGPAPPPDEWRDEYLELDLGGVDLTTLEAAHPGVFSYDTPPESVVQAAAEPVRQPAPQTTTNAQPPNQAAPAAGAGATEVSATEREVRKQIDAIHGGAARHVADAEAKYPLIFYLEKGFFSGPARIELPGIPTLVIDPDEEVFLARGLLRMLEPYATEALRFSDWKLLTEPEWEHVRRTASARPYLRLKWMDSFIHSDGFLAKHLDPGASFRLNNRLDLAGDYPRAFRVGTHMTIPRKLHEVARMSAVGLAEVFDVVNAYEAIGYVETVGDRTSTRR